MKRRQPTPKELRAVAAWLRAAAETIPEPERGEDAPYGNGRLTVFLLIYREWSEDTNAHHDVVVGVSRTRATAKRQAEKSARAYPGVKGLVEHNDIGAKESGYYVETWKV